MNPEKLPDRMSLDQKLRILGMTHEDLDFFCSLFVKSRSKYLKKKIKCEWASATNKKKQSVPLTDSNVADHLLGKYFVAAFSPEYARYLCFDLDPSPDQISIYKKIKEWLKTPLVFRSSSRGGIHIYSHFSPDFFILVEKLLKIAEATCRTMRINLAPGRCEIFPILNKGIRLPLGQGSLLLDPDSLTPICTDVATAIRHISKSIKFYSFEDLFPELNRRINETRRLQASGL